MWYRANAEDREIPMKTLILIETDQNRLMSSPETDVSGMFGIDDNDVWKNIVMCNPGKFYNIAVFQALRVGYA